MHACSLLGALRKTFSYQQSVRYISALKRATAELDEAVSKSVEDEQIKPRQHPGVMSRGPFVLPEPVKLSIQKMLKEGPKHQLLNESQKYHRYILSRELPKEEEHLLKLRSSIEAEVVNSMNIDTEGMDAEQLKHYNEMKESKVTGILKQRVYNWSSLDFTEYSALLYLITRSAAEHSAVSKVLSEISVRTSFEPKTIFDFGSGVGSVIWAADYLWGRSISEYYCVDSSSEMINLLEKIINEYNDDKFVKKIFTRQFLPSSNNIMSDIVVSAYSLLELPSSAARKETIKNLWNKTNHFLVLIENGTLAGFKIINEARQFLLSQSVSKGEEPKDISIFSPCPHDLPCPRQSSKNICYFESRYFSYPLVPEQLKKEFFCYVVFRKGTRDTSVEPWPRIVQPVLCRSRHTICRFCTSSGALKEVIFSPAKHGKIAYRCAKSSNWGDLFPCKIKEKEHTEGTIKYSKKKVNKIPDVPEEEKVL